MKKEAIIILVLECLALCHSWKKDLKILNGRFAKDKEFPYVVAISGMYICTGTLISWKQVLSSGRCYYDRNKKVINWKGIRVVAGSLANVPLGKEPKDPNTQIRRIWSIAFGRGYDEKKGDLEGKHFHDISFATVDKPFNPAIRVRLAKLPGKTSFEAQCHWHEKAKRGKFKCSVVGWGTTQWDNDTFAKMPSQNLKVAEVVAWNDCRCKEEMTMDKEDGTLHGEVCLESVRKGEQTCDGDTGAPIICGGVVYGVVTTVQCYVEAEYSDHRKPMDKQYGILLWNYWDSVDFWIRKSHSIRLQCNAFFIMLAFLLQ